ncbi:hypothetical protein I4U23_001177 [Adineta vaga]|nr:hypothetical protein I4U23_001177 [Adineta vaga]
MSFFHFQVRTSQHRFTLLTVNILMSTDRQKKEQKSTSVRRHIPHTGNVAVRRSEIQSKINPRNHHHH